MSCGFRVYDVIRTFISRINQAVIRSWEVDITMTEDFNATNDDSAVSYDSAIGDDSMILDNDSTRSYTSNQPNYPDPRNGYVGTLWDDLSGDFQWDKVRAEMIGIVATECMRLGNWATRISLAPVNRIRNCTPQDGRGSVLQYGQDAFSLARAPEVWDQIQRPPMGRSEFRWHELLRQQIITEMVAAGPLDS